MSTTTEYGQGRSSASGLELDVRSLGRTLRRSKLWILVPTLLCCALAAVFVTLTRPRYTADAKVIVENGESFFTRPDKSDQQSQTLPDDEAVQSQVQLISSRDIAREAIRRLNLKGNAEFDPLASLDPVSRLLVVLGLQRDPTAVPFEDRILQAYYERLTVFAVIKTRVITIEFTAADPDLAARAANTIADLYIEAQSAAKRRSAGVAAESLGTLVADLRARTAAAEAKADAFRSQNGLLVGTNNNTITAQQLADISTQLAQSRTAEADSQAKAKLIRDMIRQGRISEVPDVANNELIRRISEQRVTLRAEIAQQGRTLLPGHPRMQELNAQLQDVDSQLRSAAEKAVRTLENEARIATTRMENLNAALDTQKRTASTAGADQVQLNTLELQSRLLKEQLEFNTAKYQEALARVAAASTPADARVISRAEPPQAPSFPKKLPIILIATLVGFTFSIAILITRELISGRAFVSEPGDLRADALGLRPALEEPRVKQRPDALPERLVVAAEPVTTLPAVSSPMLGSTDVIRMLAQSKDSEAGALRIVVTSARPRRFVGPATLRLARTLALNARTILVDVDRDRPAVLAPNMALITTPDTDATPAGLSDLLQGQATFAEIIHRDNGSRLHVVPTGEARLPEASDDDFRLVLDALAETYDYVLLHTPAAAHPVTMMLASSVDVVMVMADADADTDPESLKRELGLASSAALLVVDAATVLADGSNRIVAA